MDQVKIGQFIAAIRKEQHYTQQELGEKLGVTNKTISRWENGNYMPDVEMLKNLSEIFNVSLNELLAGERLSDETFRKRADENLIAVAKGGAFSFMERKQYWISKWRKDHISLFVLMILLDIGYLIGCIVLHRTAGIGLLGVIGIIEYGWQNNRMMAYVESHLYGDGK